jgi:hypothetical protein
VEESHTVPTLIKSRRGYTNFRHSRLQNHRKVPGIKKGIPPALWEAEIGRIAVRGQPGQNVLVTWFQQKRLGLVV